MGVILWLLIGCRSPAPEPPPTAPELASSLVRHGACDPCRACLLLPHEDEQTAFEVARSVDDVAVFRVEGSGGRFTTVRHAGRSWRADPNRIFSEAGLRRNVEKLEGEPPPEPVLARLQAFAAEVRASYGACVERARIPVWITLHNNTDGDWSARSYLPGGEEAEAAAEPPVLPPDADPDDFFLVTARRDREALAPIAPVVLQAPDPPDDGSLSVALASERYLNVEAQHGHREEQEAMLRGALDALE